MTDDYLVWNHINPLDEERLAQAFQTAQPFRYFWLDGFLRPEFAQELYHAYPVYRDAVGKGRQFRAVNENLKVQVTRRELFPEPVRRLDAALASPEFLAALERITGIPKLLADEQLVGGGMHLMDSGGRLDVHVDFNLIPDRALHRRLNILVYLNEEWREEWGGHADLWNPSMTESAGSLAPFGNRCLVFNTTESSFHGVTPVRSPAGISRNSFAAYYYTKEAPQAWDGTQHTTIFRARPGERWRERVLVPLERVGRSIDRRARRLARALLGRRG